MPGSASEPGPGSAPEHRQVTATLLPRAVLAWATLGIALLAVTPAVRDRPDGPFRGIDLVIYGQAVLHAGADDLYLHTFLGYPFAYPPSAALLLLPLAGASTAIGLAWFALGVAAVWVTMTLIARDAAPGSWWARRSASALLTGIALLSYPVGHGLVMGQVAAVLMAVTAMACLGAHRRTDGVLVGLAAAIKLTPAVFAVWFWMNGRRRAAITAGLTFLAATALAAVAMPASSRHYYLALGMFDLDRNASAARLSNQSVLGVAARAGLTSGPAVAAATLVALCLLVWALVVARSLARAGWTAASVALVGVWSGLAAPLGWVHSFGWLVPLATAIALRGGRRPDRLVAALLLALAVTPILVMLPRDPLPGALPAVLQVAEAAYLIVGVLVTAWLQRRIAAAPTAAAA